MNSKIKREKVYTLFREHKMIPFLFMYFILVFILNGFKDMSWLPWFMFGMATLGLLSLLYDSFKIWNANE